MANVAVSMPYALLIMLVVLMALGQSAYALIQRGVGNLSFESPVISSTTPCRVYISQDKVPFWQTNHPPTNEEATAGCTGAPVNTTIVAPIFEIWRGPRNITGNEALSTDLMRARSGQQFIELNATQLSEPRQNICLIQGETVRWRFSHNGRNAINDQLLFRIGPNQVALASTSMTGQGSLLSCVLGTCSVNSTVSNGRWADYTGTFTHNLPSGDVPMRFESLNGLSTNGNFLDDIQVDLIPVVEFAGATITTPENAATPPAINITLVGVVPAGGMNLALSVAPTSTATIGVDYTINGQSNPNFNVFVPAGDYQGGLTIPVPVQVVNDTLAENNELFSVSLRPSTTDAYRVLSTTACGGNAIGSANYTINDNDIELRLQKNWVNATTGDQVQLRTTGLTNNINFAATANTATEMDLSPSVNVNPNQTATLSELFNPSNRAVYTASAWSCTGGGTQTGNQISFANADLGRVITCSITNTATYADLAITKTNNITQLQTGQSTTYAITVTNTGPNAANGAIVRDPVAAGLSKTNVSCSATGGAVCPASLSISALESPSGLVIPTLPSNGQLVFSVGAQVTANTGSVSNTATVAAPPTVNDLNQANNSAADTDLIEVMVVISGRVFEDNSGTTGNAMNAYNGVQNTGETGIAGSAVQLTNCAANVLATTQTDALGDYRFAVLAGVLSTPNFCIRQTNLDGYTSVSGTAGYNRTTDTISVINVAANSYGNRNFGDARLNLILTTDGQQTTTASGTVSYPHILRSTAVLDVGAFETNITETPQSGWAALLYRDTNCNAVIDPTESALSSTAVGQLLPNQDYCVVQRVNAPAQASAGAQHVASLSASYQVVLQDGSTITGNSNSRQDITLISNASLIMSKQVRVVADCATTSLDNTSFSERNQARNGDFLEYQIAYRNTGTRNLSQVRVRDSLPTGTLFKSAQCGQTPENSSCQIVEQPTVNAAQGNLNWLITGPVPPAQKGMVHFCVQIPALAEPPLS